MIELIDLWRYKSLLCVIKSHKLPYINKFYLGYVRIDKNHKCYGLHYNHPLLEHINVISGLTFSSDFLIERKSNNYWFFGFDTASYSAKNYSNENTVRLECESLAHQLLEI